MLGLVVALALLTISKDVLETVCIGTILVELKEVMLEHVEIVVHKIFNRDVLGIVCIGMIHVVLWEVILEPVGLQMPI